MREESIVLDYWDVSIREGGVLGKLEVSERRGGLVKERVEF